VELAIATQTSPSDWMDQDAGVIATAVDVINRQAEESKRKGGRKHG
jgi:hypothetical protein